MVQIDIRFRDFVKAALILEAKDREGAIRECVHELVRLDEIPPETEERIVDEILDREDLGSSGMGRGFAVPHTRHRSLPGIAWVVAVSNSPLDWNSLDGEPVHVVFLKVAPPDRPASDLRALECLSRMLRDDTFLRFLKQSRSAEDIWQLLNEADEGLL